MRLIPSLCVALLLAVCVLGAQPSSYKNKASFGEGLVQVEWSVLKDELYVSFTAATDSAWVAFGFTKEAGSMVPAEAVIGTVVDSQPSVDVYLLTQRRGSGVKKETADGSNSTIFDTSMTVGGGKTTVTFARKLTLADASRIQLTSNSTSVLWAVGSSFTVGYHKSRGTGVIDLITGGSSDEALGPSSGMVAHGILMFLAWGVLLPVGVLVARYGKDVKDQHTLPFWFRWHRMLQWSGVLLSLVAIILAFVTVKTHLAVVHAWIGLFVIIFGVLLQPLNTFIRPHPGTPNRWIWNLLHWWTGRLSLLVGFIAVLTGIRFLLGGCDWTGCDLGQTARLNSIGSAWQLCFLVWLCLLIAVVVVLEWRRKRAVTGASLTTPLIASADSGKRN